jgi:hypothetical protein
MHLSWRIRECQVISNPVGRIGFQKVIDVRIIYSNYIFRINNYKSRSFRERRLKPTNQGITKSVMMDINNTRKGID